MRCLSTAANHRLHKQNITMNTGVRFVLLHLEDDDDSGDSKRNSPPEAKPLLPTRIYATAAHLHITLLFTRLFEFPP